MKALAITTTAILGLIASAIVWFVMRADPMGGEPVAVIEIDPNSRPVAELSSGPSVPDVKAVTPVVPPPPSQHPQKPDPANAVDNAAQAALEKAPPSAAPVAGDQQLVRLSPVPIGAVVETSRYGPLPKIASDGRRPSEVYARPAKGANAPGPDQPARIALLITGLGLSDIATTQAIDSLPGEVTLAFGPYGRNLDGWVRKARDLGHEVMLQVPLEPFEYPDTDPGPHTLLTSLPAEENLKRLHWIMSRFTGYTGITNHMGAKFAATQESFLPVLEEVKSRGLIYLDDGTAARSTAGQIARDLGLDYSVSQVLIDDQRNAEEIELALKKLEAIAQEKGFAIGVGTSLPLTIGRVAEWARQLKGKGIELIPISAAVRRDRQT